MTFIKNKYTLNPKTLEIEHTVAQQKEFHSKWEKYVKALEKISRFIIMFVLFLVLSSNIILIAVGYSKIAAIISFSYLGLVFLEIVAQTIFNILYDTETAAARYEYLYHWDDGFADAVVKRDIAVMKALEQAYPDVAGSTVIQQIKENDIRKKKGANKK